jgi:transposase-like protein
MEQKPLAWSKLGRHFADADAAREYLEFLRWGNAGPVCPHCGGADPYKLQPRTDSSRPGRKGLYKCRIKECRKQFTVTVGTVFEDSHIAPNVWLQAIYLIGASKKGISAHQLHRMMGITYRSAWFMMHRLRYAMSVEPLARLTGTVEIDETYVGAKKKRGSKRGRPGADSPKSAVVALVERHGKVKAAPMERVTTETLSEVMRAGIASAATVVTDELPAYRGAGLHFAAHERVNHSQGEYVRGNAHTNTVEGFFSLLKRGINGTFHHVGKGHLGRYVDEFAFRYNIRQEPDAARPGLIVQGAEGKRLTYKQPVGESEN